MRNGTSSLTKQHHYVEACHGQVTPNLRIGRATAVTRARDAFLILLAISYKTVQLTVRQTGWASGTGFLFLYALENPRVCRSTCVYIAVLLTVLLK